jgi:hypothetical protein
VLCMHAEPRCSHPAAAALFPQEQAYLQKYPGRPRHEWGRKVQRYKPPGSNVTAEISLWEVVSACLAGAWQTSSVSCTSRNVFSIGCSRDLEWCTRICLYQWLAHLKV